MKRIILILLVIVAVVSVLTFSKNMIARTAISVGIRSVTGLGVSLESIDIGILSTKVHVKGLKILNPEIFQEKLMADIPEIYIDYDLPAMFKKEIHIEELRLDLKEFVAVKNADGELNLNSLKIKSEKDEGQGTRGLRLRQGYGGQEGTGAGGSTFGPEDIKIDNLSLKIGKIVYKDYSSGGSPVIKEYNLDIDEKYSDINDLNTLVRLIIFRAVVKSPLSKLVNMDLGPLTEGLDSSLKQISGLAGGAAGETLSAGKEVGSAATDAAKGAVESLKGLLPFGSREK